MFPQAMLAITIGIALGTITGLTPGIHINLASVIIVALAAKVTQVNPEYTAITIISMAITHTFTDTIPSIFLGVPDPEKVAVVLPTHRMVFEGKAYEAVMLTIFGSFASLIASIALMPLFIAGFSSLQSLIKNYMGVILVILTAILVFNEKKRLRALAIFLLSGILGMLVLNMPNLNEPLLPLLSGLFGLSTLILGIKTDSKIPEQKITNTELDSKTKYKAVACAIIAGAAGSFLPGIGPSQIAILGSKLFKGLGEYGYIIIVGGLNTVNMALSIGMLYATNKARNGAIINVSGIVPQLSLKLMITFCIACLISAGVSTILTIKLSSKISGRINKINYKKISIAIIAFITILVAILSSWIGLLILITSTSLGILCNYMEIGKNHMMGCLLLPVILFFLPIIQL